MGPQRQNWSFPYYATEIIAAIEAEIALAAEQLDESIDSEQDYDRRLAEYRESLRVAGVTFWATAKLDPADPDITGYSRGSNPSAAFRDRQKKLAIRVKDLRSWLLALQHDVERDNARLFRLTADDLAFFGLTKP